MSLETPSKIRILQRKLYLKAKAEPSYRFYLLYDKIYREDVLAHAYELAESNKGAPSVDGQTLEQIESQGLMEWLNGIGKELRAKTYAPLRGYPADSSVLGYRHCVAPDRGWPGNYSAVGFGFLLALRKLSPPSRKISEFSTKRSAMAVAMRFFSSMRLL